MTNAFLWEEAAQVYGLLQERDEATRDSVEDRAEYDSNILCVWKTWILIECCGGLST